MKLRAVLLAAALFTHAAASSAQTAQGFAADRFDPSERGSSWFAADSLDLRGHVRPAFGVGLDWAYKPLVVYNPDGSENAALLEHQVVLHPGASLVLWERLRLGADVPVAIVDSGATRVVGGVTYAPSGSASIGDVRLSADVRLVGKYDAPFTLAGGVALYLPSGSRAAFTGDGTVRAEPRLLAAGRIGSYFVYAAHAGVDVRPLGDSFAGTGLGTEIVFAAAAGVKTASDRLVVGPELFGSTVVGTSDGAFARRNTPLEAILGAHYSIAPDWRIGAGVGPGITRGLGNPELRTVAMIEWSPAIAEPPAPPPPTPAPAPAPAPAPTPAPAPRPDSDGDGVWDGGDACPRAPGIPTTDPKTNGCPPDRDSDGVLDTDDACPDQPGPRDADPKKNGCPPAFLQGTQIKIRDPFKFRFNSTELDPAGDPILEAVLTFMKAHPELKRIRIEGHTDDVGGVAFNQRLSEGRAASVRKWLVAHGIDAARLTSKGFGQTQPVDTNATDDGRRNNRRVEFHVESETPPVTAP